MKLEAVRFSHTPTTTLSRLFVDGQFECYLLEDAVRPPEQKQWGRTAIPAGRYQVVITLSARFGLLMPELLRVPGYQGVRIHAGNTAADTLGCLLTGSAIDASHERVLESRRAYQALFPKLQAARSRGEAIWLHLS